jgi:hypothetical protein
MNRTRAIRVFLALSLLVVAFGVATWRVLDLVFSSLSCPAGTGLAYLASDAVLYCRVPSGSFAAHRPDLAP